MHQSFAFREKERLAPFYDVVASITAEEFGHVELVSNTINLLLADTVEQTRPTRLRYPQRLRTVLRGLAEVSATKRGFALAPRAAHARSSCGRRSSKRMPRCWPS